MHLTIRQKLLISLVSVLLFSAAFSEKLLMNYIVCILSATTLLLFKDSKSLRWVLVGISSIYSYMSFMAYLVGATGLHTIALFTSVLAYVSYMRIDKIITTEKDYFTFSQW